MIKVFGQRCLAVLFGLMVFMPSTWADTKPVIGVVDFQMSGGLERYSRFGQLAAAGIQANLVNMGRFAVIERSQLEAVVREQRLNNSGLFDENELVRIGKLRGINFLIFGNILTLESKQGVTDQGNVYYNGQARASVKIVDLQSGQVLFANTYNNAGGMLGFFTGGTNERTAEESLNVAIEKICRLANADIAKAFPIRAKIVGVEEQDRNGRIKTALIDAGNDAGIKVGQVLEIYATRRVGPLVRETVIGSAKVIRVEDANFAIIKITDGTFEASQVDGENATSPYLVRTPRE